MYRWLFYIQKAPPGAFFFLYINKVIINGGAPFHYMTLKKVNRSQLQKYLQQPLI